MNLRPSALPGFARFALSLAIVGCGGGGTSTSVGPIAGSTFSITDQISAVTNPDGVILLTSAPGACASLSAGIAIESARELLLVLSQYGAPAPAPGTYDVSYQPGAGAWVAYSEVDSKCTTGTQLLGVSGTVTLTSAANGAYTGSADMFLTSNEHIAFSFATTACPALDTFSVHAGTCP